MNAGSSRYAGFITAANTYKHEFALRVYAFIVLAHWAEHLVQAFQIFVLHMPRPASRGVLGQFFPWLVSSETMHYGYALFMLIGLWILRSGFVGRAYKWWMVSLVIQFWHHIEHLLLQIQAITHPFWGSPVPTSVLQLFYPRVELHLFYNTIVFIPMAVAMYMHLFPTPVERAQYKCTCAID
ncbi:MAG: hypothetical protein H7177_00030 [Rhizobacter sp.]|nr:hypothetical protein [Bacteriovorax sp.]